MLQIDFEEITKNIKREKLTLFDMVTYLKLIRFRF